MIRAILTALLISTAAHAADTLWFPLWVQQDKLVTMLDNPAQKAQMIAWGRELWPLAEKWQDLYAPDGETVTGRVDITDQVIEAYLVDRRDNPIIYTNDQGEEWNLLMSNAAMNMLGKFNYSKVNDSAWLGQIRSEMRALNPIKGGYYVTSIPDMAEQEGLTPVNHGVEP